MRPRKILASEIPPCAVKNRESQFGLKRVKMWWELEENMSHHVINARKSVRIELHRMSHERKSASSYMENWVFSVITWKSTWHSRRCATAKRPFLQTPLDLLHFQSIFRIKVPEFSVAITIFTTQKLVSHFHITFFLAFLSTLKKQFFIVFHALKFLFYRKFNCSSRHLWGESAVARKFCIQQYFPRRRRKIYGCYMEENSIFQLSKEPLIMQMVNGFCRIPMQIECLKWNVTISRGKWLEKRGKFEKKILEKLPFTQM